jgi:hypothetical protein
VIVELLVVERLLTATATMMRIATTATPTMIQVQGMVSAVVVVVVVVVEASPPLVLAASPLLVFGALAEEEPVPVSGAVLVVVVLEPFEPLAPLDVLAPVELPVVWANVITGATARKRARNMRLIRMVSRIWFSY